MTREAEENLRSAAETQLASSSVDGSARPAVELLHELQVHQFELEMQNETLREARNALEESRDRYVDLYEQAPVGYLTLSESGFIVDINLPGAALLGQERRKLTHRPFAGFVVAEDKGRWDAHLAGVLASADKLQCELALQRRDGSRLDVRLDSQRQASDGALCVVRLVLTDISERKQAAAALHESEQRFRAVFENAPDGILLVGLDGHVRDANPAACVMHGYARDEFIGRHGREWVHPAHLWQFEAALVATQSRESYAVESVDLRRDGTQVPVEVRISRFVHQGESMLLGLIRDISERKQAEDALREQAVQLKTLSRRLLQAQEGERRRVAIELHDELGQSLTAIKINLQVRERIGGPTTAELQAENVAIVDNALQQVRRLALALRPSMLDDLGLVPALRWLCEQTGARNDLLVGFAAAKLPSRLAPEIETACFRIVQESLTNIVRHAGACQVTVALRQEGDTLVVCIEDDGCGFDLAAMRRQALAGACMGVVGMQERAALIGGRLTVESTPGQGSRLRLCCPLQLREKSREESL
jgi:PAS domain S-box-containing protein